jgi:hypothetical protein
MGNAATVFTIVGGTVTAIGGLATLLWWSFRQGRKSGRQEERREAQLQAQAEAAAKVASLETRVAELDAELDSLRPKRRRLYQEPKNRCTIVHISWNRTPFGDCGAATAAKHPLTVRDSKRCLARPFPDYPRFAGRLSRRRRHWRVR